MNRANAVPRETKPAPTIICTSVVLQSEHYASQSGSNRSEWVSGDVSLFVSHETASVVVGIRHHLCAQH